MKNCIKILATLGLAGAGCSLILRSRGAKWKSETRELVEKLVQAAQPNSAAVCFADFQALPAPVAAYFRFALQDGQQPIRTAQIWHKGEFSLNHKWIPFASVQNFSAHPAGFVWDAKMKMNRFLDVRVRDSFLGGRGAMKVKLMSLFSMMNAHDDAGLDAGSLMRYLAELVWLPTALLPSKNLQWTPIDDQRALATLSDGETTVSLEFSFNERGEINSFFAPARPYSTKSETREFPWAGRLWSYQQRNGVMIPLEGEVSWQMPEGNAPYYKGKIVDIRTETFAPIE